jgi:glycosyltransferase involved in cell wall biosynthesis
VVNAAAIRSRLLADGIPSERIRLIRNSVDADRFVPASVSPANSAHPGAETIVLVSRLDPEKDVSTALHAMERITRIRRGVVLKIAGVGPEQDRLVRLAESTGLAGSVEFKGRVRDIPGLLAGARLGILTSRSNEGLSNAILEYMAASLPVVATDCGGNGELVIHRETGYVVPAGDSAALADAVLRLLSNPELAAAMGHRGREIVARDHAPVAVQDAFRCLYADIHAMENTT